LLSRHVALIGEQVVLADFVRFSNVSGSVIEYVRFRRVIKEKVVKIGYT
jgi:hypothetical protein